MKISMHIHSRHSHDSSLEVKEIIKRSMALGYDAIAITDHNTVMGSMEALAMKPESLYIIVGAEFSTDKGHILALFIDEQIEKQCKRNNGVYVFEDLVKRVRAQNGILFLAHPIISKAKVDHTFIRKLDGIEMINGRVHSSFRSRKGLNFNKNLDKLYKPICIGGSDAHTLSELENVYMIIEDGDIKAGLLHEKEILFKKSPMFGIAIRKLLMHRRKNMRFIIKQLVKFIIVALNDLFISIKGNHYKTMRAR